MTKPTLYAQIKKIADKTVKHYKEDVTIHDKKSLKNMQPGDIAFWTPREHGSYLIILPGNKRNTYAIDWYEAYQGQHKTDLQWYCLEFIGRHVWKVSTTEIETAIARH